MRISIASDVHLEFGGWRVHNPSKSDLLILAGDILVAHHLTSQKDHKAKKAAIEFLDSVKGEFDHVIAIMGNHELYNGDFATTPNILRDEYSKRGIVFLDNEVTTINDVKFIGGTMWTSCNNRDPIAMIHIKMGMNDFQYIRKNGKLFTTTDACDEFDAFVKLVKAENDPTQKKTVVISHHAPSRRSIHEKYLSMGGDINYGYYSDLDNFIADSKIDLWVHGHTHDPSDYHLGDTRVVCNPRGYVGHEIPRNFVFFPLEVEI